MNQLNTWEDFWKEYRSQAVEKEEDLFFQVGRTTNKKPMDKDLFDSANIDIAEVLRLDERDVLMDLCCGNGLSTYEFRNVVDQIIAVDFSDHMIKTARKFKSAPNITYFTANILQFLGHFDSTQKVLPTKFLMNGGLPYFTPDELAVILGNIKRISRGKFISYFTIVPNDLRKWNYYNTKERKEKYLANAANNDFINDGIGRWWKPAEIEEICKSLQLACIVRNQQPPQSNYRMDIIISEGQ